MKVLFPTACSDLEMEVVQSAKLLCDLLGASITVMSVVNAPVDAVFDKDGNMVEDEDFDMEFFKIQIDTAKDELVDWLDKSGVDANQTVKAGLQIETILRTVRNENFDMVMITNAEVHDEKGILQGVNPEHIVLNSEVPVLSIRGKRTRLKDIALANNFRRKRVPVEFVKRVQEAVGATLHLVRVNTPRKFMSPNEVKANMEAFVDAHNLKNVEYHIIEGKKIKERLGAFCEDLNIDLLAIGSKQRKGLTGMVMGCPSKEVVNALDVPVLTFKSKTKK